MTSQEELYQSVVVEHGNHPRREGKLDEATHQAKETNPLCGDRVILRLVVQGGVVKALRFEVRGCLLSKAAASLMGEVVEGRTVEEARTWMKTLEALVRAPAPPSDVGALEPLLSVRGFPARIPCVELPWKALASALGGPTPT